MKEKQIELIRGQINKLDGRDFNLDAWKDSTIIILSRIFGNTHYSVEAIKGIKLKKGGMAVNGIGNFWDNMDSCKKQGKEILEACIINLENFEQLEKKEITNSDININLTQNQNQIVNVSLFISALEDELTMPQLEELKEIMKTDRPKSEKKKKIIDKIKSFGSDVASNILGNILTSPSIWNNI